MTNQIINVGSAEQAGDGESIRSAFVKINENFTDTNNKWGNLIVDGSAISTSDDSDIQIQGNIIPSADATYDLGSSTKQWRSIYVGTNTLYINNIPISLDGSGNLTVNGTAIGAATLASWSFSDVTATTSGNIIVKAGPSSGAWASLLSNNGANSFWVDNAGAHVTSNFVEGQTTENYWTFGADGLLTFPNGDLTIGEIDSSLTIKVADGKGLSLLTSGDEAGSGLLWIDSLTQPTKIATIIVNNPLYTGSGDVGIVTGDIPTEGNTPNIWNFSSDGKLTLPGVVQFPDSSIQETAYRFSATSSAPTMTTGAQWYNSNEGRLYVNYNNNWVEASPTQLDPTAIRYNDSNQVELPNQSYMDDSGEGFILHAGVIGKSIRLTTFDETGDKSWVFGADGVLEFPDNSTQTTAYRYNASSTPPTTTAGALWFNSNEGRLYVNYNNTWIEASPNEIDLTAIRFDEDGSIVFPDGNVQLTAYRYAATATAPSLTHGGMWFNSNEGRLYVNYNNTWIEASPTQLDPTAIRYNSSNQIELPNQSYMADTGEGFELYAGVIGKSISLNVFDETGDKSWVFGADGRLEFPDESSQSTAYRYNASTTSPLITDGALWYNSVEGKLYINYNDTWLEASPTQVDPSALRADADGIVELPSGLSISPASVYIPDNGTIMLQNPGETLQIGSSGTNGYTVLGWAENPNTLTGGVAGILFNTFGSTGGVVVSTGTYETAIKLWEFKTNGTLQLPAGGTIVDSTGTNILDGLGGVSISDFGEGFSLTAADKIVTNKLYSTNATQPTQHYRLELDTNGIVVLPDQSIINGSTIRGIYGTGELNYTGITIGPDAAHREESWVWVDYTGVTIATEYSTDAYTWKFDNNGSLTLPGGSAIGYTPSVSTNITVNAKTWAFGVDGNLTLPVGGEIHSAAGTGNVVIEANDGNNTRTWTFGTDGSLQIPGDIRSEGNINIEINLSDSTLRRWQFGEDGNLTFPDGTNQTTAYNRTTGSWTVATGSANYSFTVPQNGTYTMWVRGNIPDGIITWNATATVTNTNVPVMGQQFAWNYTGGGTPLEITAIPNQFVGTANTIVSSNPSVGTTSNVFTFTINNDSGSAQTVYWGYVAQ